MYNLTITNINTLKNIETYSFETKKEANKKARQLKKEYEMSNHAGHVVNYSTGLEINKQY